MHPAVRSGSVQQCCHGGRCQGALEEEPVMFWNNHEAARAGIQHLPSSLPRPPAQAAVVVNRGGNDRPFIEWQPSTTARSTTARSTTRECECKMQNSTNRNVVVDPRRPTSGRLPAPAVRAFSEGTFVVHENLIQREEDGARQRCAFS